MKAIVDTAPGVLEFLDVRKPEPMEGRVRIKTAAGAVCATDIHMIDGSGRSKYRKYWDMNGRALSTQLAQRLTAT